MKKRSKANRNSEYFHIFNRGVEKRSIFLDNKDFDRFLTSMTAFNTKEPIGSLFELAFLPKQNVARSSPPLVEIVSYCLNPNHFHLLLRQRLENGISSFIQRLSGGYTRYFNIKYKRSGVLFQGKYKSVPILSNEQLLYVSAYINLNNHVHRLGSRTTKSSWDEYMGSASHAICTKDIILGQFHNKKEYEVFAKETLDQILENKELAKELKQSLVE